jgi:hypothetical protein
VFDGGRSDIGWIDGRCEIGGRWNWWDEARCRGCWIRTADLMDFEGRLKGDEDDSSGTVEMMDLTCPASLSSPVIRTSCSGRWIRTAAVRLDGFRGLTRGRTKRTGEECEWDDERLENGNGGEKKGRAVIQDTTCRIDDVAS